MREAKGVSTSNGDNGWWGVCGMTTGACQGQLQIGADVVCSTPTTMPTAAPAAPASSWATHMGVASVLVAVAVGAAGMSAFRA